MILPGFVGPSYVLQSPNMAIETLKNWMPQSLEVPSEKAKIIYLPTPGIQTLVTLPTAPVRGLFSQDNLTLAVGADVLYSLDALWNPTKIGTLSALDGNPVIFSSNGHAGHQVYITSGGQGNIYDTVANTVTPITAAGYPTLTPMGTYLDSYFLTIQGGTAQFNFSALLDGTSWDALDFNVRISASDNLVGIIQNNKIIYLIGSATSEPWYDAGILNSPFQEVPQVLIPTGTCAPFSICRVTTLGNDGAIAFLHQSANGRGEFVAIQDYAANRISTFAQEQVWATYGGLGDCVSFSYLDQGHEYIVVTFPSGNATWVYDVTQNLWHQRTWWNVASANDDRQRQWVHCLANGTHLVGDWKTGQIYKQDTTLTTDDGTLIRRQRRAPHLSNQQMFMFYSDFQLDMETGLGNLNGAGSSPTALLQWSDDGGHSWNSGIQMPAGAQGDYQVRCMAHGNLGRSRDRVFQVTVSDPIPWRVLQAYITVAQGTN